MLRVQATRIQNFKSIVDSGRVELEPDITGLIGQNESGKTNFLKGLKTFNRGYSYSKNDLCNYDSINPLNNREPEDIPMVSIWFDGPIELLEEFESSLRLRDVCVTKYFDDSYQIEVEEPTSETRAQLENLGDTLFDESKENSKQVISELNRISEFKKQFDESISKEKFKKHQQVIHSADDLKSLEDNLENAVSWLRTTIEEVEDEQAENAIDRTVGSLESEINDIQDYRTYLETQDVGEISRIIGVDLIDEKVFDQFPNFIFHENVDQIQDELHLNDLIDNEGSYKTFRNLAYLSELDVSSLADTPEGKRLPHTERASTKISGEINDHWEQEEITVRINADGDVLSVWVDDESESMDRPSNRSKGFQWFLSFYINFTAGSENEMSESILLLDDPGVYLHPSGQKNLLETLEDLTEKNQIIYNTHSPFLIDKNQLQRLRILEREEDDQGTQIQDQFHNQDRDVLAPVRAAFGAQISDSLFGNHKNILVEGYSDKIIFESLSKYFRRRNKSENSLNPDKYAVINVGGASKMPYFAKLIEAENYDYLILLDSDNQGHQQKRKLERENGIDSSRICLLEDFIPKLSSYEATTEDLFDNTFYHNKVLSSVREDGNDELIEAIEGMNIPEESVTSKYGKKMREADESKFKKTPVAKQIRKETQREGVTDEDLGSETIDNFRKVFTGILGEMD